MLVPSIEMLRFWLIGAVFFGTMVGVVDVHAAGLRVKARGPTGKVKAEVPMDGYSLVMVFEPRVPGLVKQIKGQPVSGMHVEAIPVGTKGEEVRVLFSVPIAKHRVTRKGRRVVIEVELKLREQNLRERILKTLKVPVPSTFVGYRFNAAESLMRSGRFEDALVQYKELAAEYELRAWSQLRLADVALLNGDSKGACRRYDATSEAFGVRVSGMLARVRRQVLGCGIEKGTQADWDVLLERADRVPGRIGDFLRMEVVWSMNQVSRPEEVDMAIELLKNLEIQHRPIKRQLRQTRSRLLARAVRLSTDPIARARMCYRHQEGVRYHEEGYSLRLLCARSYRALNLLKEAEVELKELSKGKVKDFSGAMWRTRKGRAQALFTLAEVYNELGDPDYVYATLVRYQRMFGYPAPEAIDPEPDDEGVTFEKLPLGKLVRSLDRRVYALERAVRVATAGLDNSERRR